MSDVISEDGMVVVVKSRYEMSQWERERVEIGDPIACDMCGEAGVWLVWDPSVGLASAIAQSEFSLDDDKATYMYVCEGCELKRELLKEEEGE